jgi:hypothetical protein
MIFPPTSLLRTAETTLKLTASGRAPYVYSASSIVRSLSLCWPCSILSIFQRGD